MAIMDPGGGTLYEAEDDVDAAPERPGPEPAAGRAQSWDTGWDRMVRPARDPDYDSVVVAGNGVGALAFAARLARSPDYAGRVVVVAPPIAESRRLISGVSLRARAADYLADALGVERAALVAAIAGSGSGAPALFGQTSSLAQRDDDGIWQFSRHGRRRNRRNEAGEPCGYGFRNSRIVAGVWGLADRLGVRLVPEMAESAAHLRALAPGTRPLMVNATADARLLGAAPGQPNRMVLASQVPFVEMPHGITHPLQAGTAHTPLVRREGSVDAGYFIPYADPLSPRASWYGLLTRTVPADCAFDPQRELEVMTEELFGLGAAFGLLPDEPEQTLGCALVPAAPEWGTIRSAPGCLELRRAYFAGSQWFYADGMMSAAAAGLLAARAVLSGADPDRVVRRALRSLRWQTQLWWLETSRVPLLRDRLMHLRGRIAPAHAPRLGAPWPVGAEVLDETLQT
ncbi:hypothetical protein ACFOGJ_04255 [Marinibaculum pumilum]|uniref:Uncharacterized protein n=1 Tax=Marinibaculum pumilum TaxID=1766165 RepID=A0ABV7KWM5_9PROT